MPSPRKECEEAINHLCGDGSEFVGDGGWSYSRTPPSPCFGYLIGYILIVILLVVVLLAVSETQCVLQPCAHCDFVVPFVRCAPVRVKVRDEGMHYVE